MRSAPPSAVRPKTVMHHSVSIYAELGVRGRTEATAWGPPQTAWNRGSGLEERLERAI
ncbi:MAG: hypothetical protein ABI534_09825 [Chloroflexota bacterium]